VGVDVTEVVDPVVGPAVVADVAGTVDVVVTSAVGIDVSCRLEVGVVGVPVVGVVVTSADGTVVIAGVTFCWVTGVTWVVPIVVEAGVTCKAGSRPEDPAGRSAP